jgi:hypothetical protein
MSINQDIARWALKNPTAIALTDEKLFQRLWNGLGWTNPKALEK